MKGNVALENCDKALTLLSKKKHTPQMNIILEFRKNLLVQVYFSAIFTLYFHSE